MRWFLKPVAAVPFAMTALIGLDGAAMAQQSTDAIIDALKPSGNIVSGSTRGIKMGGGAPAAPAAPSPARPVSTTPSSAGARPATHSQPTAQRPQPQAPISGPSVNLTVNFPTGSADLTPAARASLDALGKALASNDLANFRFRIEGHTDTVGSPDENRALSQRRAEAVVSYLTSQYRVQPSRLEAVGMGQDNPLVPTPPQTPEARNRRVQVINLGT